MNKQLRQFEKESGLEIYGLGTRREKWEAALEKYAELIVRECIEQVWYTREDGINGNVSQVIKDRIKEHFGVE